MIDVERSIAGSSSEAIGTLTVVSTRFFAIQHVTPRLSDFMVQNPKLQFKVELAERFPDLRSEDIDILFGVSLEGSGDLVRKRITTTRYVLCASPTYLKKNEVPHIPQDLTKHRYITHSMRKPDNVVLFKEGKEIFVQPVLLLNDTRAMRECALLGMGLVKLHDYVVADALSDRRLIEVLTEFQEPQIPVYLYYQHLIIFPLLRNDFLMNRILLEQ